MPKLYNNLLLTTQFIPHGHCYLWKPTLIWLHIVSDSLIALSYYSIPITIIYLIYKRRDLPFNWIFQLFSIFIVACGTCHWIEVWTLWYPTYWLSGYIKAITAVVSLLTSVVMARSLPEALGLPNLTQLIKAIQELEREITDRQRVEEALRESNERFRSAFDYAAIGMALVATDGRWLQVNHTLCDIFGYSQEEFLSTTCQAMTHPDDIDIYLSYLNQMLNGERYHHLEKRYIHKGGNIVWVILSLSLIRDINGQALYFIVQIIDITERKRIEETLKQQACIFENISDGIIITDLSGNIVDCNSAAEKMFGYARVRSSGKTQKILHQSENSAVVTEKIIERTLDTGRWTGEMNFTRKDGTEGICEKVVVPLYNQQGQPTATIEVNRDITERKQAEAALKQANEQLSSWVKELETRNNEIDLLSKMSDFLQACLTNEEAYKVIAHSVQSLFPKMSGGVFIISHSKYLVEAVTTWGNSALVSKKLFAPEECWGLRRGRAHFVESNCDCLQCRHMSESRFSGESLCVPMMAQGEALGMLYLTSQHHGHFTKVKQQLASRVAEHIALALANLKLREALQQQSTRDPLTGLFNRRYLEEFLEREIYRAERKEYSVGVIMIDVDHFKNFNDIFGHEAGDTVLRKLGEFLQQQVRKADIACRYGGEEFVMILPETSLEVCLERAEQIRERVKHLDLQYRNQPVGNISLSLGVAIFPTHGLTPAAVMQAADKALYSAKQLGRDRVMTAAQLVNC